MKNLKLLSVWLITVLLIGCNVQPTSIKPTTITSSATTIITPTLTPLPTFIQPTIVLQTKTPVPTLKKTLAIPFSINNLRVAFVKDGNLYLQNGINPAIQLTNSGDDRDPVISEDGEKIIFYRGNTFGNVYSINADGSQEQAIIESQSLSVLGRGDIKALTFVPNTHSLLFNTYLCNSSEALYDAPDCTVGIYSVDADSGEINQLVSGLSGNGTQSRNFEISPDGHYISIASSGHLDIYFLYLEGIDVFQQDAIPYPRTIPDEFLPLQYWLPDSSGLIAILPADKFNEPTTPPYTYTVWRYTISNTTDNNSAMQLPLDPPVIFISGCNFSISPGGNWIFYISDGNGKGVGMPSLYIGNLTDGHSNSYDWRGGCPSSYATSPQWSSDNQHFASQSTIGAIDGISISIDGDFRGWIDTSHFFYETIEENMRKTYIGEIGGESLALPEGFQWSPTYILMNQ